MVDNINRRTILSGVSMGIGLVTIGTASADETQAQYVVASGNPGQLERSGFTVVHEITGANVYLVRGPEDEDPTTVNGVEAAFEDFAYGFDRPAEPTAAETEGDLADEQWDKHLINAFDAHEYATGEGTRIGIIDTGVADTHPDLGNVDTDASRAFVGWEEGDHTGDVQYHGTHVAGIAGATGETGVTGVAPDAEIVSLRTFPSEGPLLASVGDTFLALDHAAEQGLDVVNMSIGSPPQPPRENQEGYRIARQRVVRSVAQRGTAVVASAGNDSQNLQQGGWISLWGTLPRASSISATTADDELAEFSNYGANEISVGAPGADILSTFDPDNEALPGELYASISGTSMSAPQVAGLSALVRELEPDANANQVENAIERGATDNGRGGPETGAGRIDALETVRLLR
ncbi:S8 family serine peptidase [Natronococcus sp. A-GB7]|uniref:S8 family peptidase n=1 Tax=Natronococcus sp. A-GB7 TaxID=3037649 RepID=UPI00241C559E|nr:S8 family serine peptidase [Natronococcus sp. A-GB7]MDG5820601.1 S8 family serine peptidase [Natronococcus sp. A-GB7]